MVDRPKRCEFVLVADLIQFYILGNTETSYYIKSSEFAEQLKQAARQIVVCIGPVRKSLRSGGVLASMDIPSDLT